MSVVVKDLLKKYGEQIAVNNISFSLEKGEIVGFLGPNGAGKSTTMKMITGYLLPDAGTIHLNQLDALQHPLEAKKKIGYLPEANPLYYDMYVREYLGFIANIHHLENKKKAVEEVIVKVGLSPEAAKKTGQLSKGYKQRVGLAAALIHDPEVLILDEPTSGLDPNQIIEIRSVISELAKTKTILFSSHIMQEIEALCKRVIIINKGNIVADGDIDTLQKNTSKSRKVFVEFDKEVNVETFDFNFVKASKLSATSFEFETADPDEVKKNLLRFSVENNLNIVSLQSRNAGIEEVFKSLTK
ncbi:MAG: gliding motility-associated ABC transporter ATP-binding subunit GldA [Bacteroidetes bacterium]|nr:gliding motility-associated ABC transporter ATP-binding subunit GldA [Bacteroidota bacterium]